MWISVMVTSQREVVDIPSFRLNQPKSLPAAIDASRGLHHTNLSPATGTTGSFNPQRYVSRASHVSAHSSFGQKLRLLLYFLTPFIAMNIYRVAVKNHTETHKNLCIYGKCRRCCTVLTPYWTDLITHPWYDVLWISVVCGQTRNMQKAGVRNFSLPTPRRTIMQPVLQR
jgi:hypothetical protein